MIVVDSSVWIDYLGAHATPQVDRLHALIDNTRVAIGDLMLAEVLQGIRSDRTFEVVLTELLAFETIVIASPAIAVEAARNFRRLRQRGITIRKTIDTLIATRCIVDDHALLFSDPDFDPFVRHLGLRSALAEV